MVLSVRVATVRGRFGGVVDGDACPAQHVAGAARERAASARLRCSETCAGTTSPQYALIEDGRSGSMCEMTLWPVGLVS
jgi:hypothetical protein